MVSPLCLRARTGVDGPWLQDVQGNRASLLWTGGQDDGILVWESAGRGRIEVVAQPSLLPDGRTLWKARLEGLGADAEVRFWVGTASGGTATGGTPSGSTASGKFTTRSGQTGRLRFLAFGDSGTGSEAQLQLADRMSQETADLMLHTGDIAYPLSTDEALEEFYFKTYRGLMSRMPFYPCPGNHDYVDDLVPYRRWHSLPASPGVVAKDQGRYYGFEAQGVEFLSLDSNDPLWEGRNLLPWLDGRLAASRAFWRIVFFHHPPYTSGNHAKDETCRLAREQLAPRLEAARIPLVLNGHEHSYQRMLSGATNYVISGGGGGGLYESGPHEKLVLGGTWHHYLRGAIDGWRMQMEAVGLEGEVLDRLEIAPEPTLRSVVNAASFQPKVAAGSLVSVFGYHLSAGQPGLKLSLDGQQVNVIGASGGQLNLLLPQRSPGRASLRVETPNGAASIEFEIVPAAPALFRDAQGRPVLSRAGLKAGDRARVYLTGSGGRRVRLRAGRNDLGLFTAQPVLTLAGVEEVELVLPVGWEELQVEAGV